MSIVLTSKSGADGKLRLEIPVDEPDREFEVEVVVRLKSKMTPEEWRGSVASLAGSWEGDFERMPQGEFEEREPLS